MKKYPKYKFSGVEWIGDVPEHWEISKIKFLPSNEPLSFIDGDWIESKDIIFEEGIRYITTGNVGEGKYKEQGHSFITEETFSKLDCTEIFPGDLLISRLNNPIGRSCIVPELGFRIVTSVDNVVLRPKKGIDRLFLNFLMNSVKYYEFTDLIARGATMQRISRGLLAGVKLCIPPPAEQTAIAHYLDRKTAQLDQTIAEKEKLIALFREERQAIINHAVTKGIRNGVKMKDSGVAWIGEVPEGWEVKRLKHVASIFGRIGFRGYTINDIVEKEQGVISLSPGNIKNDILTLETATYISFEKYYESPEIMIFPDDIVLVKTGSTIGKTAIIPENTPEMTLNPQLVVLKELKIFPKFLYFQTTCPFFKNSFEVEQTGGTTPTISQEKVNSFPIVLPPDIAEQKEIVKHIDQKTTQIATAILGIEQEIALLQEYRQAMIFEAVTGKIDVRGNNQN